MAGRPRTNAPRKPSGRLREQSFGRTPKREMQCAFLVGSADPALAESPMGVLVAHRLVDHQVWKIADDLMRAKKLRYGSYGPALPGDGTERGHETASDRDAAGEWAKEHIARCDMVLATLPNRKQRDIFHNFVVEQRFPRWMLQQQVQRRLVLTRTDDAGNLQPLPIPDLLLILGILERLGAAFSVRKDKPTRKMVVSRNFQQAEPEP